jgi:hypothetical protein
MEKGDMVGKLAIYAFIGGVALAIIFGIYQAYTIEKIQTQFFATNTGGIIAWLLVIIGAIVGLLAIMGKGTITKAEVPGFLTAGIALLLMYAVFGAGMIVIHIPYYLGSLLSGISLSLAFFMAPAVGLLALKAAWDIGKSV